MQMTWCGLAVVSSLRTREANVSSKETCPKPLVLFQTARTFRVQMSVRPVSILASFL